MIDMKYIGFDKWYKIRVKGYLTVINYTLHNHSVFVNMWVDKKWGLKCLEQMVLQDTDLNITRLECKAKRVEDWENDIPDLNITRLECKGFYKQFIRVLTQI